MADIEKPELCEHGAIEINERWRADLLKLWRGAQAITLSTVSDPERKRGFKKIQRIKLQKQSKSELPREDIDEIMEALAESIKGHLTISAEEAQIEPGEHVHFVVEVSRMVGKAETPSRPRFFLSASLDGDHEDVYDAPENEAITELERLRAQHLETMQRQLDGQSVHIENLQETILKLATINSAPIAETAKILEMGASMQVSGSQALLQAMKLQFDHKAVEAEHREKTRRVEVWVNTFGKHVMPYIPAMGAWLMNKAMGGQGIPPDPTQAQGGAPQQTSWPIVLSRLHASITEEQRDTLIHALTRSELSALYHLLEAPTEDEVFARYAALIESIDDLGTVIESLREAFNDDQIQAFMGLHFAACSKASAAERGMSPE